MIFIDGADDTMILDTSQGFGIAVRGQAFEHVSLTVQLAGIMSDEGYEHQAIVTFYVPLPPEMAVEVGVDHLAHPVGLHSYILSHGDMEKVRDLLIEMCDAADNPIAWREKTESLLDKYDASEMRVLHNESEHGQ